MGLLYSKLSEQQTESSLSNAMEAVGKRFVQVERLLQSSSHRVSKIAAQLHTLENLCGGNANKRDEARGGKGYLPRNSTMPEKFAGAAESWKTWKEDVAEYLDSVNNGMMTFLDAVGKEKGP